MTTGTVEPYLSLPEDINTPKPSYFFNVFWMIHSYINLVLNTPDASVGIGIIKLYAYRMGVMSTDTSLLEKTYLDRYNKNSMKTRSTLSEFANGMISYNIVTLIRLISNTLVADITRNFGDSKCLTSETIRALMEFCRFHQVTRSYRDTRMDSINSLVETCRYNAMYHTDGVESIAEIIAMIETINKVIQLPLSNDEYDRRNTLLNYLRVLFYVGCRYYKINLVRFDDQNIQRPYRRNLGVSDHTLAAIPFDPSLIQSCADEGSTMSRFGIEYVQSLYAVLSQLGGVSCTVNFSAIT